MCFTKNNIEHTYESKFIKLNFKNLFKWKFKKNFNVEINDTKYINKLILSIDHEYKLKPNEFLKRELFLLNSYIECLNLRQRSITSLLDFIYKTLFLSIILLIVLKVYIPEIFYFSTMLPFIIICLIVERKLKINRMVAEIYFYNICINTLKNLNKNEEILKTPY